MSDGAATEGSGRPAGLRTTRRRGRTSAAKTAALRDLGPRWSIPPETRWRAADLDTGFGRRGPLLVDIGVGDGEASRAWAIDHPDARVLAIEVHRPGLAKLLGALDAGGPDNVRVVEADALAVLDALEEGSARWVRVLFPDPWPKRRHVRRRLVDRAFVGRVAEVLEPAGELHVATDWDDYADHVRSMVATDARFTLVSEQRPTRPETTYEARGMAAGRTITDLTYRRV